MVFKPAYAVLVAVFSLLIATIATPVAAQQPAVSAPPVAIPAAPVSSGKSWILMDYASGNILAGENIDTPMPAASITKVMTSYVVAAEIAAGRISETDEVFISERAWREGGAGTAGSFSALVVKSRVNLKDVLTGLIVQSGNDASIALAEHVAGTEEAFADLMNSYAKQIGMQNTFYVNAHGLDAPGHVTTARDIALLGQALIRNFPEHYALYSLKEFTYNGIRQHNRNNLLWKDASVDGIKTGHTDGAGYCLVASAKRGDQRLISVVLGIEAGRAEGFKKRESENLALLNWGFRFYQTEALYKANEVLANSKIWKGASESFKLGVSGPILVTIPRGRYNDLKPVMNLPKQIVAPMAQGQQVGTVRITLDGATIAEAPLIALEAVSEAGFFGRVSDEFWMWWESD